MPPLLNILGHYVDKGGRTRKQRSAASENPREPGPVVASLNARIRNRGGGREGGPRGRRGLARRDGVAGGALQTWAERGAGHALSDRAGNPAGQERRVRERGAWERVGATTAGFSEGTSQQSRCLRLGQDT